MWTKIKCILSDQHGQAVVLFAFVFIVLLGFAGLAIDVGYSYIEKQHMQNAVDNSARAGAQDIIDNPENVENSAKDLAQKNGLIPKDIVVTKDTTQNTVKVDYSQDVSTFFMRIFHFDSLNVKVSATAQVTQISNSTVFNYVIFSDSDYNLSAVNYVVDGMVHINGNTNMSSSGSYFNQRFEAVGKFNQSGSAKFAQLVKSASPIPMPAFDINYYKNNATKIYSGNMTLSNSDLAINGIVYVDGNVNISGNSMTGVGTLVVNGSINISGSNLKYSSNQDVIGFYAGNVNINFSGNNLNVDGLFYAPNGSINYSGSNATFNGGIVAKKLNISGSSHHYIYDPNIKKIVSNKVIKLIK